MTDIKICGLTSPEALQSAVQGGARYVGLVFYPPSPRYLDVGTAAQLARMVPTSVRSVGLFVNPTDPELEQVLTSVPLDMIQLQGEELPARVAEIRETTMMPILKAIRIGGAEDLLQVKAYEEVADQLLFDAKPPEGVAALPGGNALSFDWSLLAEREFHKPWMLAGGLNAGNVGAAINICAPPAVDTSSGVEDRPGHKDPALIDAFIEAVKAADAAL